MVHAIAFSVDGASEEFEAHRFIRRADIDLLMACAQKLGDHDAKLLAELLLRNQ